MRVAYFNKRFKTLTYWVEKNVTETVYCSTLKQAKMIIERTGIKQTIKKEVAYV